MVSWQYWHYCECDDPTTSGAGGTQSLVSDPRRAPTGDNVKLDKLAVLARPYPQAVAGTPVRYGFDRDGGSFELEYATDPVGGGSFQLGADTQVFVPARHFPRGYDVVVEGAEPVSEAGARQLRVRTCTGRRRVKLTVVPGQGRVLADCLAPGVPSTLRKRRKLFRIQLAGRPRRAVAGRRTRFFFRATVRVRGRPLYVRGARVRFAGRRARTGQRGGSRVRARLARPGRYRAIATRRGVRRGAVTVRAVRRR